MNETENNVKPEKQRKPRRDKGQPRLAKDMKTLAEIPVEQIVRPPQEPPSVAMMLGGFLQAIQSGQVTSQHVELTAQMMKLYRETEKDQAEKNFATAFVKLQNDIKHVRATRVINGKNGEVRSRYASYNEIMTEIQPHLTANGFSFSYSTEEGDKRLTSIGTLLHKDGHSRSNKFAVRYSTPPGASDPQGDMSTKNYAKRGVICDALNIVFDYVDDAKNIGKTITPDEARDLAARVAHCGANEERFLLWANSGDDNGTYETISEDKLDAALRWLEQYEQKKNGVSPEPKPAESAGNCVHCGKELVIENEKDGSGVLFLHKETGALKCEGVK